MNHLEPLASSYDLMNLWLVLYYDLKAIIVRSHALIAC